MLELVFRMVLFKKLSTFPSQWVVSPVFWSGVPHRDAKAINRPEKGGDIYASLMRWKNVFEELLIRLSSFQGTKLLTFGALSKSRFLRRFQTPWIVQHAMNQRF